MKEKKFKFIDLFSGIGGFHQAMSSLGGECVFASEIDQYCIETYKKNYSMDSNNDITKFPVEEIPSHDVLCAGFPCQTFSKAGNQGGFEETRGTLFYNILEVLEYHKTQYIILENVRNLVSHDNGHTWKVMQKHLNNLGYRLTEKPLVLSPHQLKIPQLRERVFILGELSNKPGPIEINLPKLFKKEDNSIFTIVNGKNRQPHLKITKYEEYVLEAWNEFYLGVEEKIIGFPIWTDYFLSHDTERKAIPKWKDEIINKNKVFYANNKEFIDKWLLKYDYLIDFRPTDKKFEWQAGDTIANIWEGIIQFRPSGIRVKRPDVFPTLVAIVHTPIIGKYRRRLSVEESRKLQSFSEDFITNENDFQAYKQFGNSVNVEVVKLVAKQLLPYSSE